MSADCDVLPSFKDTMSSSISFTLFAAVVLAFCACVGHSKAVYPCGSWVLYKQCGEKWSNHALGSSSSNTICDAGCAMSSVAMSLATYHERIHGHRIDPGTLNKWLTSHGGYVDSDLIVWNSVAKLGGLHMLSDTSSMSPHAIRAAVEQCQPVIVNVREGSHWVLVTGFDTKDTDTFYVNDPGFLDTSYDYSGMSNFVVYGNSSAAVQRDQDKLVHQTREAVLHEAARPVGTPLSGLYGVDVSQPTSQSAFECMKNEHDVSFVIIRSYTELGSPDSAVVDTAKAARAAGISVGVYHFPDTSKDAASQTSADIKYLQEHGVEIDTFWVDVERSDWGSNQTWNTIFIKEIAETARASSGAKVGIYSSHSQWQPITGDSTALASFPLWWPTYNYQPNFDGFSAFGGWTTPYMHQYKGNINLCGAGVDVNWRP